MKSKLVSTTVAAAAAVAIVGAAMWTPAQATASSDDFYVKSLSLSNGVIAESEELTGDDSGFVAISGSTLLNTGNDGVGTFASLSSLAPASERTSLSNEEGTFLFTNLKTQTAHMFVFEMTSKYIYDLTGLVTIDSAGNEVSGSQVSLSQTVTINNNDDYCTIFASGFGRVAIWDGCEGVVYDINISSGSVSVLNNQREFADYTALGPTRDWTEAYSDNDDGSWGSQSGILEYVNGTLRFVLSGVDDYDNNIVVGVYRYVPSSSIAPELVLETPVETEELSLDMSVPSSSEVEDLTAQEVNESSPEQPQPSDDPAMSDETTDFALTVPEGEVVVNGVDLWNFTASTSTNQWCGHTETNIDDGYVSLVPAMDVLNEPVWCFDASFSTAAGGGGGDLAKTGQSSQNLAPIAGLLVLVGVAALWVLRRRAI